MTNHPSPITAPQRFTSVDALRGLTVAAMLLVNNPGDWGHVYAPLLHAQWNGCTPTDLVFPFFLFIVGVSIAVGILPAIENGAGIVRIRKRILWRGAKIIALGLLIALAAQHAFDREWFRPWGVLQRIGVCFIVTGLFVSASKPRTQWIAIAALLLGYWALMAWGGSYAPYDNLASRVDVALLGRHVYDFDAASGRGHDPEGLLSTLPAVATVLLGVRIGAWLRQGKLRVIAVAGVLALLLGGAWSLAFPINKNLWTSSYVLWTGGWAMLALAAAHVLIDQWQWPALGRRFGVNAITAFAGSGLLLCALSALGWWDAAWRIGYAGWMTPRFGPYLPSLAFALSYVLLWWCVVYVMDKRGWYLKI
ncbi:MAG: heparan-alpha-glucosaminide N-acetyltransferase domain-containing protein [Pseudoxanthomonas sp.]